MVYYHGLSYIGNMNNRQVTIGLDMECNRIVETLARKNYRTKQAQLKVILLEEGKRHNLEKKEGE